MARLYSGGSRYYRSKKKKDAGGSPGLTFRIGLFAVLIVAACTLRFADTPLLTGVRDKIGSVVRTDTDYRGAVEVIGRAVAGEAQHDENAIMVFGKKILGLDGDEEQDAEETTAPQQAQPPADQPVEEGQEGGGPGLHHPGGTADQAKAGDFSGFAFDEEDYAGEAQMPVFVVSHRLLGQGLLWDEMDDNTPNEEFEIPSPDIVDDKVYTLPFDHAAPATGRVSSYFGYRIHPISGNTTFHHGADLAIATGTGVKAFADGTVAETGYHNVYGYYVKLEHEGGFLSMYAHLDKIAVKKGKKVKLGDKIAESGNSGYSTGAHLHFEIRKDGKILNPFDYVSFD